MAKRISKTSTKQTAAVKRTKKETTLVKKSPIKKQVTAVSGDTKSDKQTKSAVIPPKSAVPITKSAITIETPNKIERQPKGKAAQYLKILSNASREEYNLMGEKVKRGEIVWAFFAIDGDKTYHYYRIIK